MLHHKRLIIPGLYAIKEKSDNISNGNLSHETQKNESKIVTAQFIAM